MTALRALTDDEALIMDLLGSAATCFAMLPASHPSDLGEFVLAIHAAQNIVLARPGAEAFAARARAERLRPPIGRVPDPATDAVPTAQWQSHPDARGEG